MKSRTTKTGLRVLGAGASACAACCAEPILGFLAAAGVATVLGAVVFGVCGILVVLAVTAMLRRRRRRQADRCTPAPGSVSVDSPLLTPKSVGTR